MKKHNLPPGDRLIENVPPSGASVEQILDILEDRALAAFRSVYPVLQNSRPPRGNDVAERVERWMRSNHLDPSRLWRAKSKRRLHTLAFGYGLLVPVEKTRAALARGDVNGALRITLELVAEYLDPQLLAAGFQEALGEYLREKKRQEKTHGLDWEMQNTDTGRAYREELVAKGEEARGRGETVRFAFKGLAEGHFSRFELKWQALYNRYLAFGGTSLAVVDLDRNRK